MTALAPDEFQAFAQYLHRLTGITLEAGKAYLLETRLDGMLRAQGCSTFGELLFRIRGDTTRRLERQLIDQMTTGETLFFRDQAPFELLRHKLLPELIDRKTAASRGGPLPIRIWSAACSSGQELYSVAMVLRDLLGTSDRYAIQLLGTDISDRAVAASSRGVYNAFEIERGLPPEALLRHFSPGPEGTWKVRDELRALATFRNLNLMEDFSFLGCFDLIFCRNVAIYFAEPERVSLFDRLARSLEPGGALLIGATETLPGACARFVSHRHLRSVFYQVGT